MDGWSSGIGDVPTSMDRLSRSGSRVDLTQSPNDEPVALDQLAGERFDGGDDGNHLRLGCISGPDLAPYPRACDTEPNE